jgi:hypothetical protein
MTERNYRDAHASRSPGRSRQSHDGTAPPFATKARMLDPRFAPVMLAGMAKKKAKKKPAEPLTAAAILARMHAEENQRRPDGREVSKKRRQHIKKNNGRPRCGSGPPVGDCAKCKKNAKSSNSRDASWADRSNNSLCNKSPRHSFISLWR